ncbi:putative uncharacterized protein [Clostridium sp. CAG:678]|nr:putative uncharacterized protein [Clostridium sp. CAG:678]
MRIIDKNTDFYDYLQNVYRDGSLTFDRTNSFILSKEMVCDSLEVHSRHHYFWWDKEKYHDYNFLLLQVCNTFWLFLIEVTKLSESGRPTNFAAELLYSWKNYDKERVLIKLNIITFPGLRWRYGGWKNWLYNRDKILNRINDIVEAVNQSDYDVTGFRTLNSCYVSYGGKKVEKDIPLLKASGLAQIINPLDIYLAFEEYFSLEKTATERIYSKGITDKEKILNHGFDLKTSFRG